MTTVRKPLGIPKHIEVRQDESGTFAYKCKICPKGSYFKTEKHINYHRDLRDCMKKRGKALAKGKKKKTEKTTSGQIFLCNTPTCGKQFNRKDNLERHEKIHSRQGNGSSFKCGLCPSTFHLENELERHGVTHIDIHPLKCILCTKEFPKEDRDSYERHLHLDHRGDDENCRELANNGGILLRDDGVPVPKNSVSPPRAQMAEVEAGSSTSDGSEGERRKEGGVAAATSLKRPLLPRRLELYAIVMPDGSLASPSSGQDDTLSRLMIKSGTMNPGVVGELSKVTSEKEGKTNKDDDGSQEEDGNHGSADKEQEDQGKGKGEGDNNKKGEDFNKSAGFSRIPCNIM